MLENTQQTRRAAVDQLPAPRMRPGLVGAQRRWVSEPKSAGGFKIASIIISLLPLNCLELNIDETMNQSSNLTNRSWLSDCKTSLLWLKYGNKRPCS